MKICQDAFDEAFEILYSDEDWKEEKKNDKGDLVVSRKTKTGESLTDNFHDNIIFKRKTRQKSLQNNRLPRVKLIKPMISQKELRGF